MVPVRGALVQGMLDLLILRTLTWGPRHGYAIARWLEDTTEDALQIAEGSLYPALHRLEDKGAVKASWGTSELGKRIRVYTLTKAGRAALQTESVQWAQFVTAVGRVIAAI